MQPVRFSHSYASFADLLRSRVENHGNKTAIIFLGDGETVTESLTYEALDVRVREVASWIDCHVPIRGRVLLSFNPGVDFIYAFLGCLYSGRTAVPSYPPRRRGSLSRLENIASDAQASLVLSSSSVMGDLGPHGEFSFFNQCPWYAIETVTEPAATFKSRDIAPSELAFLQYTSGSTGTPKGVCVSHGNLLHNQEVIHAFFEQEEEEMVLGGWLPMYHDMGLIGTMLHALTLGGKLVFMPPLAFLQKPIRWLRMNSDYRVTMGGGPNFAYDLCVNRTTQEEREGLDLSAWKTAFNGAEPLRFETLDRFESVFAPYGLTKNALCPCYGMAEATLMVTGSTPREPWRALTVDGAALRNNAIVSVEGSDGDQASMHRLISSGKLSPDLDLAIVDPETAIRVEPGKVGEIWIHGPSVGQGYWNREKVSEETFRAKIIDPDSNASAPSLCYLRTGDMGFVRQGELYVTGRLKDLIILNGENHYPQDLEATAERSHIDLTVGACVAFGLDKRETNSSVASDTSQLEQGYAEQVFIAVEVSRVAMRTFDLSSIVAAVYQSVWEEHQVAIDGLLLVRPGGIPKTTSGKLQRRFTRQMFQDGTLLVLADWQRSRDGTPMWKNVPSIDRKTDSVTPVDNAKEDDQVAQIVELELWLQARVAALSGVPLERIDRSQPIAIYGLKSITIVQLAGELASKLEKKIAPTLIYDYPSISAICRFLICGAEDAPSDSNEARRYHHEPLAIVGMASRMPGGATLEQFRELLYRDGNAIGPFPLERRKDQLSQCGNVEVPDWEAGHFQGGFLNSVDQFDPLFFGISPREAEELDPQQRLMLEITLEAFEDAGILPQPKTRVETGVFIGVSGNEYSRSMLNSGCNVSGYTASGNSMAMVANRISYLFNFRGPSLTVDTACSSSLVAIHLAAQSIQNGECELAVAGGVSLQASADVTQSLASAGMLSPTGVCRTFGEGANGFVRGEGCGAVVLKRLSNAKRDGDRIYALLRSTAINQDGRSNGLTAPNGLSQQEVIRKALQSGRLDPNDIDYIEAHGTGTELGDPIEMGALTSIFGPRTAPLWIGSVKTNIGHLEGAAGIAGMIKTCLALHCERIPAHLNFDQPNPHIDWQSGIGIPKEQVPWPRQSGRIRRAGVSSFGFGGTNAHIILEEGPARTAPCDLNRTTGGRWIKVTAKSPEAFTAIALRYATAIATTDCDSERSGEFLESFAHTANTGRTDYAYRGVVKFSSREELIARLIELSQIQSPATPFVRRSFGPQSTFAIDDRTANDRTGNDVWRGVIEKYLSGEEIDWGEVYGSQSLTNKESSSELGPRYQRQQLPTYPFQRQRCWFKTAWSADRIDHQKTNSPLVTNEPSHRFTESTLHSELLGKRLDIGGEVIIFESALQSFPELADHRVRGESVFPAAGYLEVALAAGRSSSGPHMDVESLKLEKAYRWNVNSSSRMQVILHPCVDSNEASVSSSKGGYRGEILFRRPEGWRRHASFLLTPTEAMENKVLGSRSSESRPVSIEEHYQHCTSVGLEYTGPFRSLTELYAERSKTIGTVELGSRTASPTEYILHPALLDGCFQSIAALLPEEGRLWLPISVEKYQFASDLKSNHLPTAPLHFEATQRDSGVSELSNEQHVFDFAVFDSDRQLIAIVSGLTLQRISIENIAESTERTATVASEESDAIWVHHEKWVPRMRRFERSPAPQVSPIDLRKDLQRVSESLSKKTGYQIDLASRSKLDQLSFGWARNALVDLYGELAVDTQIARSGLLERLAIAPDKRLLFFRMMEILSESGALEVQNEGWIVRRPFSAIDMRQVSNDLLSEHPRMAPEIQLLMRCGPYLSDVLRGDVDPLPLLFSDKQAGSAVDIYTRAAGAQVLNGLLVEAAAKQAECLPEGRALRILEIGGGTGATTRLLLTRLQQSRIKYTFTDIARSFLNAAREDFLEDFDSESASLQDPSRSKKGPFLAEYLNIEEDPVPQGFEPESFDLIVAANVLHATASLDETIQNVSNLLAPGGQILLLEGTRPVGWMDLTFGLTDGWWRFATRDSHRKYPLVSPNEWKVLLESKGISNFELIDPTKTDLFSEQRFSKEPTAENVLIIATKKGADTPVQVPSNCDRSEFLLVGEHSNSVRSLETVLEANGATCQKVLWDPGLGSVAAEQIRIKMERLAPFHSSPHVVFVGHDLNLGSDLQKSEPLATETVVADAMREAICHVVGTIQVVLPFSNAFQSSEQRPKFSLLTRGVFSVDQSRDAFASVEPLRAGPIVGVMRTLWLEQPNWICRVIDLDPDSAVPLDFAMDELLTRDIDIDDEHEVVVRNGVRFGRRLMPCNGVIDLSKRSVLRVGEPGEMETLQFERVDKTELGWNEIEIEVHAAGLNFRDCLIALGKYPEAALLGSECTGIVVRVGAEVNQFQVGDRVLAITSDCFAESVILPACRAIHLHSDFDFATGASLPVAYLTAAIALETIAKLKTGSTVLIHSATGGVGLAAISLCNASGARVFATASQSKHSYLYGLGVDQVFDSRQIGFAEKIAQVNGVAGVDILLNTLDESFVNENLRSLGEGGIYIDITKPSQEIQGLIHHLRPDVTYRCFDVSKMLREETDKLLGECSALIERVAAGELSRLPTETFSLAQAGRAFRKMQRAAHIGKIVLTRTPEVSTLRHAAQKPVRADRAYAVIGGLGDLGLLTAEVLLELNAGFVALIGRNDPTPIQQLEIDRLRAKGGRISVFRADASDLNQLGDTLQAIRLEMPLAGVVHSAGTLADSMIQDQTDSSIEKVWAAKGGVAWNLHRLTKEDALDHFVLYSSLASTFGAPGQANHAAANAGLDGLADWRIKQNLPVTCINWGPWSETGEAMRRGVSERSDLRGVGMIPLGTGKSYLRMMLQISGLRIVISPLTVAAMQTRLQNWRLLEYSWKQKVGQKAPEVNLREQLALLSSPCQPDWMVLEVTSTLARVLGIEDKSDISSEIAFSDLGLDSLAGIEFVDTLQRQWGMKLPSSVVYDHPTVSKLVDFMMLQIVPSPNQAPMQQLDPMQNNQTGAIEIASDADTLLSGLLSELRRWE